MEEPLGNTMRVRLVFKGRGLLGKSQRSEGLRRCWLLLRPSIATISDLSLHILRSFHLDDLCLNGVVLSIDGFVLPLFESVCILRDSDIIRVSRKDDLSMSIVKGQNGIKHIEDLHIVEKQPSPSGVKLLAYDEFEREAGGYQNEYETESDHDGNILHSERPTPDVTVKKRKKQNESQDSRRKKARRKITEKTNENENAIDNEDSNEFCRDQDLSVKQLSSVGTSANENEQRLEVHPSKIAKNQGIESNGGEQIEGLSVLDGARKLPSRSARRKKAKRLWLRKMAFAKHAEPVMDNLLEKDAQMKFLEREHDQQDDVDDDEVMPVVVKPGHIRFEPVGRVDAEQGNSMIEDPVEFIKWNGTTCKRKGQKWGKEKASMHKVNSATLPGKEDLMLEKEEAANKLVNFEEIIPLTGVPEEGDVLAYRLIELSSSWCPELSPFRVGKVSSYNTESCMLTIVSVPGYPLGIHHNQEEGTDEHSTNTFFYKEDGSLEIEFTSLIDVRILNREKGNQLPKCTADEMNGVGVPVSIQEGDSVTKSISRDEWDQAMTQANGGQASWDEINLALNEKKAELWKQVDICTKKENKAKGSWSYKALRGSALGPTLAFLRAESRT